MDASDFWWSESAFPSRHGVQNSTITRKLYHFNHFNKVRTIGPFYKRRNHDADHMLQKGQIDLLLPKVGSDSLWAIFMRKSYSCRDHEARKKTQVFGCKPWLRTDPLTSKSCSKRCVNTGKQTISVFRGVCVCVCVVRRMNLDSNLLTQHYFVGTSLVVQRLRLWAPNAEGLGSIAGQGTKIPHAATKTQHSQINIF